MVYREEYCKFSAPLTAQLNRHLYQANPFDSTTYSALVPSKSLWQHDSQCLNQASPFNSTIYSAFVPSKSLWQHDFSTLVPSTCTCSTFFSNFMFWTSIIVQSDYCLTPPVYPVHALFITRPVLLWYSTLSATGHWKWVMFTSFHTAATVGRYWK